MLYLNNTTESQSLLIPRNGAHVLTALTLTLRSTVNQSIRLENVLDLNTSGLYFNVAVTLPAGAQDGEYQYQLKNGDIVLSEGLAIIRPVSETAPTSYNQDITYKQYESE